MYYTICSIENILHDYLLLFSAPGIDWMVSFDWDKVFHPVRMSTSFMDESLKGDRGALNGTPKLFLEQMLINIAQNSKVIPHIPNSPPTMMKNTRKKDTGSYRLGIT